MKAITVALLIWIVAIGFKIWGDSHRIADLKKESAELRQQLGNVDTTSTGRIVKIIRMGKTDRDTFLVSHQYRDGHYSKPEMLDFPSATVFEDSRIGDKMFVMVLMNPYGHSIPAMIVNKGPDPYVPIIGHDF